MDGKEIGIVLIGALLAALVIGGAAAFGYERPGTGSNPETMHEKLVFSATGCKVYQVTIKNEYGFDQLYVAVNPASSARPTTAYPTCRITK